MSDRLFTYDADQISITFAGQICDSGFGDGTFVNIDFLEDAFTLKIGTDGEGTRSKSNNRAAKIELTLMQTSLFNAVLSNLHNLDLNSPGGAGLSPLSVTDRAGRSLYTAETAWVKKSPSREYGREANHRVWMLETNSLIALDGNVLPTLAP